MIVERIFSPRVVEAYEQERALFPRVNPSADFDAFDVEYGQALGFYYLGILHNLLAHAKVRLKVDIGEPLTLGEVALITMTREATVMTAAHRSNFPTYEEGSRRLVNPADAVVLEWMKARGYEPTARHSGAALARADGNLRGEIPATQYISVPFASDGTWFSPRCATAGGYTIGAKGEEQRFQDYFEALAALMQMKSPKWRRPNEAGNRGIVTAVRYDRVTHAEIQRILDDHSK